ncbi:MAG: dockerin type I repeat-containing protein, partial [candidate division Zixibacteria bacterium]|nr:dockerin type I repeat-containing protein [candidate division Zixibacteria bacterium]
RVDTLTLPIGASFKDSSNGRGLFEFHPLYFQAGIYHVTFIARDAVGAADSEVVEITVIDAGNQTPVLDSIGPKTVQETKWLNFAIRASDADSTFPRLRASNMPPGAAFNDNGNGTGSLGYHPDYYADSVYYVVFKAIDAVDTLLIDSEVVKITVIDVNRPPQIRIQPNLTTFEVNEGGSVTFLVIGTDPDSVIPSVHVKSLPNNATFVDSGNGTGVFVFRPDYTQGDLPPAIYKVYPYVVDGGYPQDTVWDDTTTARSIWVYNVPVAPVIEPINDTSITEGQTLKIRVKATHPVGPPTLKAINLPTNATFKDSGGGIGGFVFTPSYTQAGVYGVTFIATKEKADSEFVQITVIEAGNKPPVLAPLIDSTAVCIGDTFKLHPRATDPDGPSLTLSASPLPTNSDFHDSGNGGGLFRFYPDSTQKDSVYHVAFVASDGSLADTEIVAMRVVTFIRGDANGDGFIDGADIVYLVNYLYIKGPAPIPLQAGDANNDGAVDAADIVYLTNYLYLHGPHPPGKS